MVTRCSEQLPAQWRASSINVDGEGIPPFDGTKDAIDNRRPVGYLSIRNCLPGIFVSGSVPSVLGSCAPIDLLLDVQPAIQ